MLLIINMLRFDMARIILGFIGMNGEFKPGLGMNGLQWWILGGMALGMTVLALWLTGRMGRRRLLILGAAGMTAAALTCAWTLHSATYQLTPKSYEVLQAGHFPADFMADLKGAEGQGFATEKEFVADLEKRLGADQMEPYRGTLAAAALNMRTAVAWWACVGFVASFALALGPVLNALLSAVKASSVPSPARKGPEP